MSTMTFALIAAALLGAFVLVLVLPLWRGARAANPARRAQLVALRQLKRALQSGAIDAEIYERQREALQARLAAIPGEAEGARQRRMNHRIALALTVAAPLLAVALYLRVGDPAAIGQPPQADPGTPSVDQMVNGLAQRLRRQPDDLQGWRLLGRSYVVLGRYGEAVTAYAHAYQLSGGRDPSIRLDYAEALLLRDPSALTGDAKPLIETALRNQPRNPEALWYGGLLAQAEQHEALAIRRWQALLAQPNLPAQFRSVVEQHLRAAGEQAGAPPAAQTRAASPRTSASEGGVARHTASVATLQAVAAPAPDGVEINVSLDPKFAGTAPADATLFVFARAAGRSSGPPLAVRRLSVGALPATIRLTAADAMLAGQGLTASEPMRIVARVALHGGVLAQPGDLQGSARYAGDGKPVSVRIDRRVR